MVKLLIEQLNIRGVQKTLKLDLNFILENFYLLQNKNSFLKIG